MEQNRCQSEQVKQISEQPNDKEEGEDIQNQSFSKIDQYNQIFKDITIDGKKLQLEQKLKTFSNNIFYDPQLDQPNLKIKMCYHTDNYEVIRILISWKKFKTYLMVLNVAQVSKSHQLLSSGKYCNVHYFQDTRSKSKLVIKCIPYQEKEFKIIFYRAIQEYFLFLIASTLDCAPKIINMTGFNLMVYDNCIQFSSEECLPLFLLTQQHQIQLKQKLKIMHSFGLVHRDIKPSNLCLDPATFEPLFLDFGYSTFLKQKLGQKSITAFVGSFGYSSDQMTKLFSQNKKGPVDFYFNDAFCLNSSIIQLKKQNVGINQWIQNDKNQLDQKFLLLKDQYNDAYNIMQYNKNFLNINDYNKYFLRFLVKFLIVTNNKIIFQIPRSELILISQQTLHFLSKLPYSPLNQQLFVWLRANNSSYLRQANFNYNFQQKKKKIFIDQDHESQSEQLVVKSFIKKYQIQNIEQIQEISSKYNILSFYMGKSNSQFLLKKLNKKTTSLNFYQKLLQILDLRFCRSSFDLKITICKQLLKKINGNQVQQQNSIKYFIYILDHIFQFLVSRKENFHLRMIQTIICNLLILLQRNDLSLLNKIKTITTLKISNMKMAQLLLRCGILIEWNMTKSKTKKQSINFVEQYMKIIFQKLDQLRQSCVNLSQEQKLIDCYITIIYANRTLKADLFYQAILVVKKYVGLVDLQLKIQIFLFYQNMLIIQQLKNKQYSQLKQKLWYTQRLQQYIYSNQTHFNYYHHNILQIAFTLQQYQLFCQLYFKFTQCISNTQLIQSFTSFYYCQIFQFRRKKISQQKYVSSNIPLQKNIQNLIFNINLTNKLSQLFIQLKSGKKEQKKQKELQLLTKQIKIQQLLHVNFKTLLTQLHSQQVSQFYQGCFRVFKMFYIIYVERETKQALFFLREFKNRFEYSLSQINCSQCYQKYKSLLIQMNDLLMKIQKRYKEHLPYLIDLLKKQQNNKNYHFPRQELLKSLLFLSNMQPDLASQLNSLQFIWNQIKRHDFIHVLFILNQIYSYMTLFIKQKNYIAKIIQFNETLIFFLEKIASNHKIIKYVQQISLFFKNHRYIWNQMFNILKLSIAKSFRIGYGNQYTILLFALILYPQNQHADDNLSLRVILCICENVQSLIFIAKNIILQKVFQYLLYIQKKKKINKLKGLENSKLVQKDKDSKNNINLKRKIRFQFKKYFLFKAKPLDFVYFIKKITKLKQETHHYIFQAIMIQKMKDYYKIILNN